MYFQPALASSAFAGFYDELLAYFTLFCEPRDLLQLAQTNSVFYVFCQEDPLWESHCLRLHGGDFAYLHNWKLTTFFPREPRPANVTAPFRPVSPRGFGSDFLYRRWCRGHMTLGDSYLLPAPEVDPTIKRLRKFDSGELTYQAFYEQYGKVPFIIRNAIGKWNASTEWTMEKLAARFPSDIKHRITHNLDIFSEHSTMEMSFADYWQYAQNQHDETPLYIFDARFGEKIPAMLEDYNVADLKIFCDDFLKDAAENHEKEEAAAEETMTSIKFAAGGKKVTDNKKKKPKSSHGAIRPDFRWIVIGPERTGAPWHQDPARTSAWNSLVKGRKRWAIYPPDMPPPGVDVGKNGESREHAMNMTSLMWYLQVYPTLTPEQKPWEIIQEEGETIHVPSGWWHLVLNLDVTIAVTQNFVDSHNLLVFIKDLLNDNHDEALAVLQHQLQPTRPETFDVFRLVQIPRGHGYFSDEMYMNSFRIVEYWKNPLKKVFARHQLASLWGLQAQAQPVTGKKTKIPKLKSLTARANPTFAVGKRVLVKFFSQFNEEWSEFDLESYLAPKFQQLDKTVDGSSTKRQRRTVLQAGELKDAMSLRYAMEECYRIERSAYEMITKADDATGKKSAGKSASLGAMVPKIYYSGHLMHVDEVDDEDGDGPMWRWPYIVIEYKHDLVGMSSITKMGGATRPTWKAMAKWISSEFVPKLHAVPIDENLHGLQNHSKCDWEWYLHYLLQQRKRALSFHLRDNSIPTQLVVLLEEFLPPAVDGGTSVLLPATWQDNGPVLLHGDLTDENVLGRVMTSKSNAVRGGSISRSANASDLRGYLKTVGCEKYAPLLIDQEELTLQSLALLDDASLKDLGIPLGPRLAILNGKDRVARIEESDEDSGGAVSNDTEEWETDSSSDSSDSEDEEDDEMAAAAKPEEIEEKRQAHFYGSVHWEPECVIDFADAKTGDPLYDLVSIFFSALHCDRELWKETLATPYWQAYIAKAKAPEMATNKVSPRPLRERFLQLVLLHPSRSIKGLFHYFPSATNASTWEELALIVFGDLFD